MRSILAERVAFLVLVPIACASADVEIPVEEGRVTEVRFDGTQLIALPPRDDGVVTLEDVYEAVTGRTKP